MKNKRRNFDDAKRIVIKLGTSSLTTATGIDKKAISSVAEQVAGLRNSGRQVLIVTSGAIGMGAKILGRSGPVTQVKMRQACAAIGQPRLMHEYQLAFAQHNLTVAQVLVTAEILRGRKLYLNLRNAVEALLNLGVVPIANENDCVSTAEIGNSFGDNDRLSALIASKVDAELLIMLTDIDSLYDRNPKQHANAKPIDLVEQITPELEQAAGTKGSALATGGMKTKLAAAKIAALSGCHFVLANSRQPNVISRIVAGEKLGTWFVPQKKLASRARWIAQCAPDGELEIDAGAMAAIRQRKSLLPKGVVAVKGKFEAGSVVLINGVAKAISSLGADELRSVMGKHSSEIRAQISANRRDVVVLPEDTVILVD
jgi:glutamate 5-kinase